MGPVGRRLLDGRGSFTVKGSGKTVKGSGKEMPLSKEMIEKC